MKQNESDISIGVLLRACRDSVGITAVELERRTGIDRKSICKYEKNKCIPPLDKFETMLDAMGFEMIIIRKDCDYE